VVSSEEVSSEEVNETKIESEKTDSEDNFESLSLAELVDKFESLLSNENTQTTRNNINKIKNSFNAKFALLIAEKKEAFLAEGGNVIDFNFTSPLKKKFNDLSKDFRERQQSFQKNRTQQLNQNLEIRLQIIEEIKGLINVEGDINSSYNKFKSLQERWRNTGQIPSTENNDTWNNYRHHVEIFYGFLHLNRDLRDLDFKHNLEQKQKIIQSTEELATETDLNRAFRELQALHKIWKEELGPVAKEFKDGINRRLRIKRSTNCILFFFGLVLILSELVVYIYIQIIAGLGNNYMFGYYTQIILILTFNGGLFIYFFAYKSNYKPKMDPGVFIWYLCCIRIGQSKLYQNK
jgi:hypothetical protein